MKEVKELDDILDIKVVLCHHKNVSNQDTSKAKSAALQDVLIQQIRAKYNYLKEIENVRPTDLPDQDQDPKELVKKYYNEAYYPHIQVISGSDKRTLKAEVVKVPGQEDKYNPNYKWNGLVPLDIDLKVLAKKGEEGVRMAEKIQDIVLNQSEELFKLPGFFYAAPSRSGTEYMISQTGKKGFGLHMMAYINPTNTDLNSAYFYFVSKFKDYIKTATGKSLEDICTELNIDSDGDFGGLLDMHNATPYQLYGMPKLNQSELHLNHNFKPVTETIQKIEKETKKSLQTNVQHIQKLMNFNEKFNKNFEANPNGIIIDRNNYPGWNSDSRKRNANNDRYRIACCIYNHFEGDVNACKDLIIKKFGQPTVNELLAETAALTGLEPKNPGRACKNWCETNLFRPEDERVDLKENEYLSNFLDKILQTKEKVVYVQGSCGVGKTVVCKDILALLDNSKAKSKNQIGLFGQVDNSKIDLSETKRVIVLEPLVPILKNKFDKEFEKYVYTTAQLKKMKRLQVTKGEPLPDRMVLVYDSFLELNPIEDLKDAIVILDESHKLIEDENFRTRMHDLVERLKESLDADVLSKLILMTGTPAGEIDLFEKWKYCYLKFIKKNKAALDIIYHPVSGKAASMSCLKELVQEASDKGEMSLILCDVHNIDTAIEICGPIFNKDFNWARRNRKSADDVVELLESKTTAAKCILVTSWYSVGNDINKLDKYENVNYFVMREDGKTDMAIAQFLARGRDDLHKTLHYIDNERLAETSNNRKVKEDRYEFLRFKIEGGLKVESVATWFLNYQEIKYLRSTDTGREMIVRALKYYMLHNSFESLVQTLQEVEKWSLLRVHEEEMFIDKESKIGFGCKKNMQTDLMQYDLKQMLFDIDDYIGANSDCMKDVPDWTELVANNRFKEYKFEYPVAAASLLQKIEDARKSLSKAPWFFRNQYRPGVNEFVDFMVTVGFFDKGNEIIHFGALKNYIDILKNVDIVERLNITVDNYEDKVKEAYDNNFDGFKDMVESFQAKEYERTKEALKRTVFALKRIELLYERGNDCELCFTDEFLDAAGVNIDRNKDSVAVLDNKKRIHKRGGHGGCKIQILDTEDNTVYEFKSVKEACKELHIGSTVWQRLKTDFEADKRGVKELQNNGISKRAKMRFKVLKIK